MHATASQSFSTARGGANAGRRLHRLPAGVATAALALCLLASPAFALNFPPLTGRVVDQAGIMNAQTRADLETKLKNLEDKSSIQLVVASVKSLEGGDIETYANELFRFWKLGQAKKNNGALLLVAPAERKVRIEVGYGLEGTLTDALSSVIIQSAIIPRFKTGDFSGGIVRGVDGIISVLSGDTADWQPKVDVRQEDFGGLFGALFPLLIFFVFPFFMTFVMRNNTKGTPEGRYVRRGGRMIFVPFPGPRWAAVSAAAALAAASAVGLVAGLVAAAARRAAAVLPGLVTMPITAEEYKAVAAAIRAAEQGTSGQLVCVLARASSNYAHVPILWASALALLLPWPLIYLTQWSVERIFLAQLAAFLLAGLLFSWMPLRLLLVPRAVRRAQAHRLAAEQFLVRNVGHTTNRSGVLIFVVLPLKHYARIIADEGIARRVHRSEWQAAIDALLAHVRDGRIAAGFIAAVERCGAVLAEHAPPDGSPNELPDRLYVM